MEEKDITEQESLFIIQQMINKTKQQLTDRSKYFFMWGFAVLGCSLVQYFMLKSNPDNINSGLVWLLMPALAIVHIIMVFNDRKKSAINSYNNNAIGSLWLAMGIAFFIMIFIANKDKFDTIPILILFYGIGNFVTGKILQFKPLILGAIACFILSIAVTFISGPEKLLMLGLSVILADIIPAFILKNDFKKQQVN